jgi:hypothetical protein
MGHVIMIHIILGQPITNRVVFSDVEIIGI